MTKNSTPHFSYIDIDGTIWVEMVACDYCSQLLVNVLSVMQHGNIDIQCPGCGLWVKLRDDTHTVWTDEPPEPQIVNTRPR